MTMLTILLLLALQAANPAAAEPALASTPGSVHRVPYRLTETKHLLVRAKLNGKGPYNFLIDTGAPALFVSTEMAQKAGVTPSADGWGSFDRLEIEGGAVLEKVQARVQEPYQLSGMNAMGLAGARIDGVFGYNVLSLFRMDIDLTRPAMVWTRLHGKPPTLMSMGPSDAAPPARPAQTLAQMEGLTRMLSALMQRPAEDVTVGRGFFGLELENTPAGVRVRALVPGGNAAGAGVTAGDRILAVGAVGRPLRWVRSSAEVLKSAARIAAGEALRLKVLRGEKALEITVKGEGGAL